MVIMLNWFLQGDFDAGAHPQIGISTSEEEVARDDPSEVGKKDSIERKIRPL